MTSDTATVTPTQKVDEVDPVQALNKKLIRQVEFYFSDFNLHKDMFMQEHMEKDDGWFTMDTMLQFERLSNLCAEPGTILAALKTSTKELLELDVEKLRIRRHPNNPLPENDAQFKRDLELRTVHVSGFPQTETIEELTDFLEDYGSVYGIKQLRDGVKGRCSLHKGALFVSYAKYEEAERFIQAPMVYYKDQPLDKMSENVFYESRKNLNNRNHKEKNENAHDTATVTPTKKVDEVDPVQALNRKLIRLVEFYFSDFNLHKDGFMHEHMKKDDGWFSMDTMLKFHRLSNLCAEPGTILAALKTSTKELLEVDVEKLRIRRHPNNPLPENDAQFKRDLNLRTVHVSGFLQFETIDELNAFFEVYGSVYGIKRLRYCDKCKGSLYNGAVLVSYAKYEEADRFIQAATVYYKDQPLEKMSSNDFYESKKNSNNVNRKEKNENRV